MTENKNSFSAEDFQFSLTRELKEEWRKKLAEAKNSHQKNEVKRAFKKEFGVNFKKEFVSLDEIQESSDEESLENEAEILMSRAEEKLAELKEKTKNDLSEEKAAAKDISNADFTEEAKIIDSKREDVVETAQEDMKETVSAVGYRGHLEKLKAQISGLDVEQTKYSKTENVIKDFEDELAGLSIALLSISSKDSISDDKGFGNKISDGEGPYLSEHTGDQINPESAIFLANTNIRNLSEKIGLPLEEVKEVFENQREAMLAEAKAEVAASTSLFKKITKVAGKSGLYIGAGILAGTTTMATLGLGGLVGGGLIASARIADRYFTEKGNQKKIEKKLKEIKKQKEKNPEEKDKLINKMAIAISLKKQLAIEKINLGDDQAARDKVIKEYIAKQTPQAVSLDNLQEYQDKMFLALKGLDAIDRMNQDKEEELAKKSQRFAKVKKIEGKVFGQNATEKAISTSVIAGLGLAARSIPGLSKVLLAYSGWRLGGLAGDTIAKRLEKGPKTIGEQSEKEHYVSIRSQLLDKSLQKNNPEEYRRLKDEAQTFETKYQTYAQNALTELNSYLEDKLNSRPDVSKKANFIKYGARLGGAALMVLGGSVLSDLISQHKEQVTKHLQGSTSQEQATKHLQGSTSQEQATKHLKKPIPVDEMTTKSANIRDISSKIEPHLLHPKTEEFSDKISNVGLAGKHDSVWRSTREIFEKNAKDLGYKGNLSDKTALNKWAETQTANAVHNSGHITDKVFEGNRVVLEKNPEGHYFVKVEKEAGFKPGYLKEASHEIKSQSTNADKLVKEYGLDPNKYSSVGRNGVIETTINHHEIFFDTRSHELFSLDTSGRVINYGQVKGQLTGGALEGNVNDFVKDLDANIKLLQSNGFYSPNEVIHLVSPKGEIAIDLSNHHVFIDFNKHTMFYKWQGQEYRFPFTPGRSGGASTKENIENFLRERSKMEGTAEDLQKNIFNNHITHFREIRKQLKIINGGHRLKHEQMVNWRSLYNNLKSIKDPTFKEYVHKMIFSLLKPKQ